MGSQNSGWISVHRKVRDNWLWNVRSKFCERSAWIDLLLAANHQTKRIPFNARVITVERGSFVTSKLKLAKRWRWSRPKVESFLRLLRDEEMVRIESNNECSIISIVNFDAYQNSEQHSEHSKSNHFDNRSRYSRQRSGQSARQPICNGTGHLLETAATVTATDAASGVQIPSHRPDTNNNPNNNKSNKRLVAGCLLAEDFCSSFLDAEGEACLEHYAGKASNYSGSPEDHISKWSAEDKQGRKGFFARKTSASESDLSALRTKFELEDKKAHGGSP